MNKIVRNMILLVAILVFLTWTLLPFLWILLTSLKNPIDAIAYPPKFIFEPTLLNYQLILFGEGYVAGSYQRARVFFPKCFINSLIINSIAVLVAFLISAPSAYSMSRYKLRGIKDITFFLLSTRMLPPFAFLIPYYILFTSLGLYDTYWGLILIYQLIDVPLIILMLRGFFDEVPREIEEAAILDGHSKLGVFFKYVIPIAGPGVAASLIFAFLFNWTDFLFAFLLTADKAKTATVSLLNFMSYQKVLWGQMAGACILTSIPTIAFAISVHRYLTRGLTFGALKA